MAVTRSSHAFSAPLPVTGPVIGVIGGGQLVRMMIPAAIELGLDLRIFAESPESAAAAVAHHSVVGDPSDLGALRRFALGTDVLTFEHEQVPTEHLRTLASEGVNVQPSPEALVYAQDKLQMRQRIEQLGLPHPAWAEVTTPEQVREFGHRHGWPVVLKTPRGGYDGRGVMIVHEQQMEEPAVAEWFEQAARQQGSLLLEEKVPYTRELSALVARSPQGESTAWPVVESLQVDAVCDEVLAPAPGLAEQTAHAVQQTALHLAEHLEVTGVMAVELFEVPQREEGFLINELAMRPHNSGHWTQDGSVTDQFEQHLRAVTGLPLGSVESTAEATVMKNCLGGANDHLSAALPQALSAHPEARIHLYGKSVRPGRKVGHVNLRGTAAQLPPLREAARETAEIIIGTTPSAEDFSTGSAYTAE